MAKESSLEYNYDYNNMIDIGYSRVMFAYTSPALISRVSLVFVLKSKVHCAETEIRFSTTAVNHYFNLATFPDSQFSFRYIRKCQSLILKIEICLRIILLNRVC